jgi:hypothetical protein
MKIIKGVLFIMMLTVSAALINGQNTTIPAPEDYLFYYLLGLKAEDKITSDPLIVVDGAVYTYELLKQSGLNLTRKNIYEITCLEKGNKVAVSIYGEKGRDGVVLITTTKTHDKMRSPDHDYNVLFVVGRKKLSLDEVNTIDPADIESINVIRDKEGIMKYTNRDYDGVVVITMKDGKKFSKGKKYKYN